MCIQGPPLGWLALKIYTYTCTHTVNTKRGGLGRGGCVWLSEECMLGHEYHLTVSNAQTTFGGCRG